MCNLINKLSAAFTVLSDRKVDFLAVQNVIQAELTNIFAFKHITFESCNNMNKPMQLAYYCFNFVPSGGIKTKLIQDLHFYCLNFFDDALDTFNCNRYDDMCKTHDDELIKTSDKIERRQKKIKFAEEEKKFINIKRYLSDCTQSKLYEYAKIIDRFNQGGLFFIQDEFADYFYDAKVNRDSIKNSILNCFFDLYDGTFKPTDTTGTDRNTINNIPTSIILMSDYSLIANEKKLLEQFLLYLKRGMARRSFIYYNEKNNIYDDILYTSPEEKQNVINEIRQIGALLSRIYQQTKPHYIFSVLANKKIVEYNLNVNKQLKEINAYDAKMPLEDQIISINLENSTWKIIKLAVLYHIIEHPFSDEVQPLAVEQAIEFFKKTHDCLRSLLNQKAASDCDKLFYYLLKNKNNLIPNAQIRAQNFVSKNRFKQWYEESKEDIIALCKQKGLGFIETVGARNAKHIGIYTSNYRVENNKLVRNDFSDIEIDEL